MCYVFFDCYSARFICLELSLTLLQPPPLLLPFGHVCVPTQTPIVRYCFNTVQHAPPIAVLNASSAAAAFITVVGAAAVQSARSQQQQQQGDGQFSPSFQDMVADTEARQAGLELGTYKFMGVGLNLLGISLTLSSQAAFCIQLTTIMVSEFRLCNVA